jgi:ATP-binding cassette, subfamily C (CFTR/MRP), member 1
VNECRYYLATSRELKRLDAVTRSPIFAWFSESLAGLSTIRAFNQQSVFIGANLKRVDHNQICYLPSVSVNRWLSMRLELLGALIILTVAFLAVSALVTTGVDAGLVGLVLSYALNTTSSLVSEPVLQWSIIPDVMSRTGQCVQPVRLNRILSVSNAYYTRLR